jgi:hypothetical protein
MLLDGVEKANDALDQTASRHHGNSGDRRMVKQFDRLAVESANPYGVARFQHCSASGLGRVA